MLNTQGYKLARVKKGVRPWGGQVVTILEENTYPNGRVELIVVKGNRLINDGTTDGKGMNFWDGKDKKSFSLNELDLQS